jgi:F420-dependent oxidoreductase-like protein
MLRIAVGLYRESQDDWESAEAWAQEVEKLGIDSIWSAETWGIDGITPLARIASSTTSLRLGTGILQIGARTPAALAMTALGMQSISNDRFLLGLGVSGVAIVEGWHGVPFERPVTRTKETIEIIKMIAAGNRLEYSGSLYTLPLPGGEGRAIKPSATPRNVPIWLASLGPQNLRITGTLADGWIGTSFMPETANVFFDPMSEAAAKVGRSLDDIEKMVPVALELTEDVEGATKGHAEGYAFTFGAMGTKSNNFYNNAWARQGFADEVNEVQRLWLSGEREIAKSRVPLEIATRSNLIGTTDLIMDRLRVYRDAGLDILRVDVRTDGGFAERLSHLGILMDMVKSINREESV